MFKTICDELEKLRYTVHRTPQEKVPQRELVVIMDDLNMIVESFNSYKMVTTLYIRWNEEDPDAIPTQVATLVASLDRVITQASFKFGKPIITLAGTLYDIRVVCMYNTVVNIE